MRDVSLGYKVLAPWRRESEGRKWWNCPRTVSPYLAKDTNAAGGALLKSRSTWAGEKVGRRWVIIPRKVAVD